MSIKGYFYKKKSTLFLSISKGYSAGLFVIRVICNIRRYTKLQPIVKRLKYMRLSIFCALHIRSSGPKTLVRRNNLSFRIFMVMLSFRLIYRYLIAVYHTIKRAYSKDSSKYDVEMEKKSLKKRCDNKLHVLRTDA